MRDFQQRLLMSSRFSRDYGSTLPRMLRIRTQDGRIWIVKFERSTTGDDDDDYFWFTDGWNLLTCLSVGIEFIDYFSLLDPPASFWGIYLDSFISQMHVPRSLEREHGEFKKLVSITLQTSDGESWDVKLKRQRFGGDLFLTDSWTEFVQDNEIAHEEFLIFYFLPELTAFFISIYSTDGGDADPSTHAATELKFVLKLNDFNANWKRVRLATAIGIETGEGNFQLENEQGHQWTVYLRTRRNNQSDVRYSIMDGWMGFMLENNFTVGDILLFQCISFNVVKVLKMEDGEGNASPC
ncbi:hypothetical protein C2S51_038448 [Perilla frutescens var. frutescens]|nr:hypothetical protein C2S51_038448 [Perilla frutescens var. frutescens]